MFTKSFLWKCHMCKQNLLQIYNHKQLISRTCTNISRNALESSYNDRDKEKILNIVNSCDLDTLSRCDIAKVRIKVLMKHRESIGHFTSLTEIENSGGFTPRTARSFFDSITSSGKEGRGVTKEKPPKTSSKFLYPNLDSETERKATSIASVHVTFDKVSWSVIKPENYELEEWGFYDLSEMELKKLKLADIINIAWSASRAVPVSSLYVTEGPETTLRAPGADPGNPKVISVNLQKQQLLAALVAFLTARGAGDSASESEKLPEAVVYFLKASLASRLFNTLIGREKVSSESTIKSIISSSGGVAIPPSLQRMFLSNSPYNREVLGQCLLVNLAFMEVCYYKNPASLTKLSSRKTD